MPSRFRLLGHLLLLLLIGQLARGLMQPVRDECGLLDAGTGPEAGELVRANQEKYLRSTLKSCSIHQSAAGDIVRILQNLGRCPTSWAISCLDHFNCDEILHDVSETLRGGLVSLGQGDVIVGRASECLDVVPDCIHRQHLVLNANLMNSTWARLLPPTAILVNLEQLVAYPLSQAIAAGYLAATDSRGDANVVISGRANLKAALALLPDDKVLGVSVDDYRGFVALTPESAKYPWLEYSYRNADVANEADQPCNYIKPIGISTKPVHRIGTFRGEIDFLHIGGVDVPRRAHVYSMLKHAGWYAGIAEGYFSEARDRVLRRTTVGLNIHRHNNRHIAEVIRLLTYAAHGMLIVSECGDDSDDIFRSKIDDKLLEMEFQAAVLFVSYRKIAKCAAALLQPDTRAANATERLVRNTAKLVSARQEAALLAPTLNALFPLCRFAVPASLSWA